MIRFCIVLAIIVTSFSHLTKVAGECPDVYTEVGGKCFLVLEDAAREFGAARTICQDNGGDLAIVDDCVAMADLATYIDSLDLDSSSELWIGGSDLASEGEWYWLDGSRVPMGAPYWSRETSYEFSMEPSGGTAENCAVLSADAGFYFQDINCHTYPNYVPLCQAPTIGGTDGSCQPPFVSVGDSTCLYFLSTVDLTWEDARTVCQSYGGDLAIIDDCHLMEAVIAFVREQDLVPASGFWIGGTDAASEGDWTWVDGTSMAMGAPFWGKSGSGPLEPNNADDIEDCLALGDTQNYRFNDVSCSAALIPLCRADPIEEDSVVPDPLNLMMTIAMKIVKRLETHQTTSSTTDIVAPH